MTMHGDRAGPDAAIRKVIEDRVKAFHARDVEAAMAPVSVPFEMEPPFRASLDLAP